MSNLNAMMDRLGSMPERGSNAEARVAARNLAAAGRDAGAPDDVTLELLDMCGLLDMSIARETVSRSQHVRVHIQSRNNR